MNTTIRSSVYFVLFFFVSIAVNAQASQDSTILEKKALKMKLQAKHEVRSVELEAKERINEIKERAQDSLVFIKKQTKRDLQDLRSEAQKELEALRSKALKNLVNKYLRRKHFKKKYARLEKKYENRYSGIEKKYEIRTNLLLSDLENEIDQIVQAARLEIQKIEHEYNFKLSLLLAE